MVRPLVVGKHGTIVVGTLYRVANPLWMALIISPRIQVLAWSSSSQVCYLYEHLLHGTIPLSDYL